MLSFSFVFSFNLILHIIKSHYYLSNFKHFYVDIIFLIFLYHFLKQLLNNAVFIMLTVFLIFKCFIKFLKYMIIAK